MPEPKKPLITRERYRQYKRDQTKPLVTDEKKHTPATEKTTSNQLLLRARKAVFRLKRNVRKTAIKPKPPSQKRSCSGRPTNRQPQQRWSVCRTKKEAESWTAI